MARARCAQQQAFLRALVDLGTDPSPLNKLLARLVTAAHQYGVQVETRIDPQVPAPSQPALDELEVLLAAALQLANSASPAVIMTRCEPDGGALTLVIDSTLGTNTCTGIHPPGQGDGWACTWTDLGDQQLLEVTWLSDQRSCRVAAGSSRQPVSAPSGR